MALTNEEKGRRSGKKMYEMVDGLLKEMLEDENFTKDIFKDWAKADPKGFMQIMKDRLPRVQPIDQDLKKTVISLKAMMEGLPEVDDIARELRNERYRANKAENELKSAKEQIKLYQKKLKKKGIEVG